MEIKDPVDPKALEQAKAIMKELMHPEGSSSVHAESLLQVAKRLKDVDPETTSVDDLIVTKEMCKQAFDDLPEKDRAALVNIHARVQAFALMQRKSVVDMEMDIPGGKAGQNVSPCKGMTLYEVFFAVKLPDTPCFVSLFRLFVLVFP